MINNKFMFPQNKTTTSLVVLIIVSSIIAGYIGYYLGRNRQSLSGALNPDPRFKDLTTPNSQIFYKQTAEVRGQLTKVDPEKVTIRNVSGIEANFQTADEVFVTRYDEKGVKNSKYEPVSGADINKNAIISLESLAVPISDNVTYKIIGIEFPLVIN